MATANPFGNLHVQRDEEDEPQSNTQITQAPQQQLFVGAKEEVKKKKKVRPEKKEVQSGSAEDGFEIVGSKKNKPKQKKEEETNEEEQPVKKESKYTKKEKTGEYHVKDDSKPQKKRQFDKHSGTGRGKEISKGGAGGKGTWLGNKNQEEYEYNNDDYYIQNALNPRPSDKDTEKKREGRYHHEEKVEESESTEKKEEETKEEDGKLKGKKGKGKEEPEVKKEDLLEIPENAITADEYLKKYAKKQVQEILVARPKETEELIIVSKEDDYDIGLTGQGKKNKKQKEKKKTEQKTLDVEVKFEDVNQKRGGHYKRDYQKKEDKELDKEFHYNPDECPKITK